MAPNADLKKTKDSEHNKCKDRISDNLLKTFLNVMEISAIVKGNTIKSGAQRF